MLPEFSYGLPGCTIPKKNLELNTKDSPISSAMKYIMLTNRLIAMSQAQFQLLQAILAAFCALKGLP